MINELVKNMDFLLLLQHFPDLNKKEIDSGVISEKASKIASIFRTIFLLSNGIRSENNLSIYCTENLIEGKSFLIDIKGEKLRYLSPDERSTLLLLLKIHKIINGNSNKKLDKREIKKFNEYHWAQSTPGIFLKKCNLDEFKLIFEDKQMQKDSIFVIQNSSMNTFLVNREKYNKNADIKIYSEFDRLIGHVRNNSLFFIMIESLEKDLVRFFKTFDKLIIFQNQKMNQHFFEWNLIAIIQTIFENLNI